MREIRFRRLLCLVLLLFGSPAFSADGEIDTGSVLLVPMAP